MMLADSSSTSFRNCHEFNNHTSISTSISNSISTSISNSARSMDNLFEFLKEAQLEHYFDDLSLKLKIRFTAQLKYVDDTDLVAIGMTRPEMRRLKKYFEKEFPQTAMGKIKKRLSRTTSNRSTSVPRPQDLTGRMNSFSVRANGNGPSRSPIGSDDLTTIASVTNFSIASNGTTESSDVRQLGSKHLILQNQLTMGSLLRHGEFADIYQASFRCGQSQKHVSVKCINKVHVQSDLNEFIKEMFVQCYLDHPNIVKLYGISLDDQNIKLVTEQLKVSSLLKCLQDQNSKTLYPIIVLHNFTVQISEAMAYLEEKRVIHGHLTSSNVLLYSDHQIKITDAGLFRSYSFSDKIFLNDHRDWISPEIINGCQPTLSSDIWAFGVLLWEMFNYGQSPSATNESVGSQTDLKLPHLAQPDLCPNMIFNVITSCWNEQPRERPTFFQLSTNFTRLVPEQLIAMVDGPDQIPSHRSEDHNEPSDGSYSSLTELQMLCYKKGETIIVLDRSMNLYKDFWRGCLLNGESGYFKWSNMRAVGVNQSSISDPPQQQVVHRNPHSPSSSIRSSGRSRSVGEAFAKLRIIGRESDKKPRHGRISIDMIGAPENDFRHVGHVSNNGDVFGDVTSLYTSTAQQKIKSGTISICSKLDTSTSLSEAGSVVSSSTLNAGGDDTPPYATLDNVTSKSHSDKNNLPSNKSNISIPPPLPPTRSYSEEEANTDSFMDDFLIPNDFSLCNDGFSLFNELSKQWDMQYSHLDTEITPTSDKNVQISDTKSSLESECPTVVTANSSLESPIVSKNERIPMVLALEKSSKSSPVTEMTSISSPSFVVESPPKPIAGSSNNNPTARSSSFFMKFRTFGAGKVPKSKDIVTTSPEPVNSSTSPLYAKIKKSNKMKKQKEVNTTQKKNIISNPILISAPVVNSVNIAEENYLDCSSEVSSLQPSPRESVMSLSHPHSMVMTSNNDQIPTLSRQYSNVTNYSKSRTNGSSTSISPASSFVSLTSVPNNNNIIPQSGAAIRAIKKGDGVFRATAVVNALNRRRPSAGDQFSNDGTLSRARQPSLPLMSSINRINSSTIDRRQYQRSGLSNNELLESVLDSSATTPIASELPDLPYIDLSFARPPIEDKTNTADEDDAYNSLHSGSIGSDTVEPHCSNKPSESNYDQQNHSIKESSLIQSLNDNPSNLSDLSFFKPDSSSASSASAYANFQLKSSKFAGFGDSDEIAL